MRKAFFSVTPIVFLLLPMFARTAFWVPTGIFSLNKVETITQPAGSRVSDKVRVRISEAKRQLAAQPALSGDFVRLAAEDPLTAQIHLFALSKDTFLTKDAEAALTTSLGSTVRLRVVRANGVNTAVEIVNSATGRQLAPLVVQYPIVRNGVMSEMGYYTSAHPAIESPEIAEDGRAYVHRMLNLAASRLAEKGTKITPDIVNVAERLCVVEHTDHKRFQKEDRAALFNEITTLYALNVGNTYRYSVSSAGAGGMVQMIPSTYALIREAHPEANLKPDFVAGMRDHDNALEAMLLYMQHTWNYLLRQEQVTRALDSQIATQAELLAAGYNSNPVRLSGYLERGETAWRTLIPRETQMYLQIYAAVDSLVPMNPRS
ncbi:MAG TPA: hypothetical protein VF708_12450 [Pyrinomonadaceae bacterium]|jgi:hypothetical protein